MNGFWRLISSAALAATLMLSGNSPAFSTGAPKDAKSEAESQKAGYRAAKESPIAKKKPGDAEK